MIGAHPLMGEIFRTIENISRLDTNVLLLGESGTGKEVVARAIHELSPRAGEQFIGINCGAFSRSLLEDQLFGHVKGAFTGAVRDKEGVFVAAGRGSLFLDEIAEIDVDLQGRLLRAIQEREVVRLGSNRPERWQARLLTATNRDLEAQVARGQFRKDLYYRIQVVQIQIPPLRDRREDIPLLAEHFLEQFALEQGRKKTISPVALELLLRHDFPGNVRELRNVLERACALGVSDSILPRDLPPEFRGPEKEGFKSLSQVERDHVFRALQVAGGKRGLAARFLQIDRNRLNRMIKKHGITVPGGRRAVDS